MSSSNSPFIYVISALEANPDRCENFDNILKYVTSAYLGIGCNVQGIEQKVEKSLLTALDLGLVSKKGNKYYLNVSRASQSTEDTNENEADKYKSDGMETESETTMARKTRRKKKSRTKKRSRKATKRRKTKY